ncbi:hypothetical protein BC629DRAFT_865281 [Irpex lacteus]|nr:hypothetical protein BC629DRAFT_865281 [Irpex lacteus]
MMFSIPTLLTASILIFSGASDARSTPSRMLYTLPNHSRDISAGTTSDVCASITGSKLLSVTVQPGLPPVGIGYFSACLCESDIPAFETTNVVAMAAVAAAGVAETTRALTALIVANGQTCTYPENAIPQACSASNLCGFTCGNGFSAAVTISSTGIPSTKPNACICPTGKVVCNGLCVEASAVGACPSSTPTVTLTPARKRELEERKVKGKCDKRGMGWQTCGVWGSGSEEKGDKAWECVDTQRDVESCGGCMIPFGHNLATGIDCTAIPGVVDVSCAAGSCVVRSCQAGYRLSESKDRCVPENLTKLGFLEGLVQAAAYGLEHMPLKK